MTACMSAAAWLSYIWCSGFVLCMLFMWTRTYSCLELLDMGMQQEEAVSAAFHCTHSIPLNIGRRPGSVWIVNGPDGRRRRRRLRKQSPKPLLSSLFLTNVRSMGHKMHKLELCVDGSHFAQNCDFMMIRKNFIYPEGNSFVRMLSATRRQEKKRRKIKQHNKIKIIVTDTVFKI